MADDEDYSKLPLADRLVHKVWKVRLQAYEDATTLFTQAEGPSDPAVSGISGLVKKFVVDSNVMAQVKGIVAATAFVEYVSAPHDLATELAAGVVTKCFNSSKQNTKDAAMELCLMLTEMTNSGEASITELIKGYANKNPKIAAMSVETTTACISAFGTSVVKYKGVLKALPGLLAHSTPAVREAAKALAVELHGWAGQPIASALRDIKPVQLNELEELWNAGAGTRRPTRLTANAQEKEGVSSTKTEGATGSAAVEGNEEDSPADEYDSAEAVDVVIPSNFMTDVVEAKWSVRKDALEGLFKVLDVPKIQNSDFGPTVGALVKVVGKDTNVLNVAYAAKCLGALANGLRNGFGQHASTVLTTLLTKFKEKKANVVEALSNAADKVVVCGSFEKLMEVFVVALKDKNPSVKEQSARVLGRAIGAGACPIPKTVAKVICPPLVGLLSDQVPAVRDAAAEALAAILSVTSERLVAPYLNKADSNRAAKVRELAASCDANTKAVAPKTVATRTTTRPSTARPKTSASSRPKTSRPKTAGASSSRPKTAAKSGTNKPKSKGFTVGVSELNTPEISDADATDIVSGIFDASKQALLSDANWKERLASGTELLSVVEGMESLSSQQTLSIVKVLETATKVWKDTNFQVMSKTFETIQAAADSCGSDFPDRAAAIAIPGIVAKLGDTKVRPSAAACLTSFCEAWTVNDVCQMIATAAESARAPKIKEEASALLTNIFSEFGLRVATNPIAAFVKHGLAQPSPAVRTAAIKLATTLLQGSGPSLKQEFASEKLASQINDKFDELNGAKLPSPSRFERQNKDSGVPAEVGKLSARNTDAAVDQGDGNDDDDDEEDEDLGPRTDLVIAESTLEKLPDANWKVRAEGLDEVVSCVKSAGAITPSLGDALSALALRLRDSNRNLVLTTLEIFKQIALSMGAPFSRHFAVIADGLVLALSESKETIRIAALSVFDAVHKKSGLGLFVENDKIVAGLTSGKPNQQSELLSWFRAKLEDAPKAVSPKPIVKPVVACLGDRNAGVRQESQKLFEVIISHVGAAKLKSVANGLSGSTKSMVLEMLSKAPSSSALSKSSKAKEASSSTSKPEGAKTVRRATNPKISTKLMKAKNKDEEAESVILMDAKGKARRLRDEKNNKILKWTFTSPRDEFVNQLQDQFTKGPAANTQMLDLLFATDFKAHAKALDVLIDDFTNMRDEIFASSDILLQWITLRFFDTNPAVLLKSVSFCQELFAAMADEELEISDSEAGAFLPHLVNMSGSKLESIRQDTHSLLRSVCKTYPSSKVFQYVLEGLKSKNAKQRTELVNEISYMIDRQGMSVCQVGAAKSMKTIASQVSDRDNSARSAALDCIVTVWNIIGNDVYKLIGELDDKSMSLVLERVKRSGKRTTTATGNSRPKPQIVVRRNTAAASPSKMSPTRKPKSGVKQEFVLNLEGLNMPSLNVDDLQLAPTEIEFDDTPIEISRSPVPAPSKIERTATSPPRSVGSGIPTIGSRMGTASSMGSRMSTASNSTNAAVDHMLENLKDKNPLTVIDALKSAEAMTRTSETFMSTHANEILSACGEQARMLFSIHLSATSKEKLSNGVRLCKHLLGFVLQAFRNNDVAMRVTPDVIGTMIADLLKHVQSPRLKDLDEGPQITKALNCILLKILQTINQNLAFSSLLEILSGALISGGDEKHIQLVQRCIWKLVKGIPEHSNSIDAGELLRSISTFLTAHPINHSSDGSEDNHTRTIRTVVQALVKEKGIAIDASVDILGSEPYRTPAGMMVLQALAKTGVPIEELEVLRNNSSRTQSPVRSSHSSRATSPASGESSQMQKNVPLSAAEQDLRLVQIFAMITSKEESKQGMQDLSNFMAEYPSANINKFLQTTSPFFQNHIKRSLVELNRRRQGGQEAKQEGSTKTAAAYLNRLRQITSDKENAVNSSFTISAESSVERRSETPPLPQVVAASDIKAASPAKAAVGLDQLAALKARLAKFHKK